MQGWHESLDMNLVAIHLPLPHLCRLNVPLFKSHRPFITPSIAEAHHSFHYALVCRAGTGPWT